MRSTQPLYFQLIAATGFFFLVSISTLAAQTTPPASPLEIEAQGKTDEKGLTFQWHVKERENKIRSIAVAVRKGETLLQSAETTQATGTYFITPYSAGVFSLHIEAFSTEATGAEKTLTLETKGNLPSPCPSRPVWRPPQSKEKIKGLRDYSLADLIRQSGLIFAGKVTAIEFCPASTGRTPFTFATFSDLHILHGTYPHPELTLAFAGGVMDGKLSLFEEMPLFHRGERFLLFLTARADYRFTPTVGWTDGVLLSEKDGIKTYSGHPVIAIDRRGMRMVVATDFEPKIRPVDPAYGSHKVIEDAVTESSRRKIEVPQIKARRAISEERFVEGVKSLTRELRIPTPPQGQLLKPGTPFGVKRSRGAAPPKRVSEGEPPQTPQGPQNKAGASNEAGSLQPPGRSGNKVYGFFVRECFGDIMKWTSNSATMKRLPISFPTGSTWADALITSENQWNAVPGDVFNFNDATDNDNNWESGADGNEVAFAFSDDIDGAFAVTFRRADGCGPLDDLWPGHNMPIEEADVMFNVEDFPWTSSVPDPRQLEPFPGGSYLRPVAVHELGHAFGLSSGNTHEDRSIAIMNSAYPVGGWYPGNPPKRAMPHGDDRAGIRFIYPDSLASETDIGVLNFAKLDTTTAGAVLVAAPTPDATCPGNTLTVQYNFGNIGTIPVDFDLGFYLSTDESISTGDILVASERWFSGLGLGSYGPGVLSRTLTVPPSVAFGTEHFVGVFADFNNTIAEVEETNNPVALPGRIRIKTEAECRQARLTVRKAVVPGIDPGRFNLRIDGTTRAANVGHGGSTGAIILSPGFHTVGETAGTGTSLDDYKIVIGGNCAPDGSILLGGGENKTCTITNRNITVIEELCHAILDACFAEVSTPGGLTPAQCVQMFNQCKSTIE